MSKPTRKYVSAIEASAYSGIQYDKLCKLCQDGKSFKCIKQGNSWKIDTESFAKFLTDKIDFEDASFEEESKKRMCESDPVNHPSHYTQNKFESIDEMMIAFGPEAVYHFCICNAWKHKNRAPYKGNFEEDMKKADWYLTKAKEIKGGNLWQE